MLKEEVDFEQALGDHDYKEIAHQNNGKPSFNHQKCVNVPVDHSVADPYYVSDQARTSDNNQFEMDDIPQYRKYLAVFVMFLINLLNYMDRYTVAG